MRVEVIRKDKESNERCLSRFTKTVQRSRKIPKIRSERYRADETSKRQERAAAKMRDHYRALKEKSKFY